jgi:hypothetical protein
VVYTANIQTHYFSHTTPKKATQNTHCRNKLMLKPLTIEGTEPVNKVVT